MFHYSIRFKNCFFGLKPSGVTINIEMKIKAEISGRHVHLSKYDLHKLFGDGYELKKKRDISQPGQYVAHERVALANGLARIDDVKILGPVRNKTQIEILAEDAEILKVNAPIRKSGDIENSPGIKIIGPLGEIYTNEGVIRAERHIHLSNEDAEEFGLKNGDYVNLRINDKIINCFVRAGEEHKSAIHFDKDDAANLGIDKDTFGEIIKSYIDEGS